MRDRAVIDYRIPREAARELERRGFEVVFTKPLCSVCEEISGHADIALHELFGSVVCAPEVYDYYRERLSGTEVIRGSLELAAKYPADIAYNVCRIGDRVFCKTRHTAPEILDRYRAAGCRVIDARQGYARCSLCVVDDNSAITADEGMYGLLVKSGVETLKIRGGGISLYGMDGFIGGAGGLLKKGLLAFCGDIMTHPDKDAITAFCRARGVEIVPLHRGGLIDAGGIIVV